MRRKNHRLGGCSKTIMIGILMLLVGFGGLNYYYGGRSQKVMSSPPQPSVEEEITAPYTKEIVMTTTQINDLLQEQINNLEQNDMHLAAAIEGEEFHATAQMEYEGMEVPVDLKAAIKDVDGRLVMDVTSIKIGSLPLPKKLAFKKLQEEVTLPEGMEFISGETAVSIDLSRVMPLESGVDIRIQELALDRGEAIFTLYSEEPITDLE